MRWLCLACALAFGVLPLDARAGELTPEERDRAVKLADEGARLFEQGDFATAKDRFEQAEAIAPIPPFTYQKCRALERLGKWSEAFTCYQKVASLPLGKDAPIPHQSAKRDAQRGAEVLAPRIPKVTVRIAGNLPAELFLDGRSMGQATQTAILADPGEHVIEARGTGGLIARKDLSLRESDAITVDLKLALPNDPNATKKSGPSTLEIIGWSGIAAGGATLLAATITGVSAIIMRGDLDASCPDGRCPESQWESVDTYDALRWTAAGTLIGGLVIAAGGVSAIIFDPERKLFGGAVRAEVGPAFARMTVQLP